TPDVAASREAEGRGIGRVRRTVPARRRSRGAALLLAAFLGSALAGARPAAPPAAPAGTEAVGFDPARLARIHGLVAEAIRARQLPGAVLLVRRGDRLPLLRGYGPRPLRPALGPVTTATVWHPAPVPQVVAT